MDLFLHFLTAENTFIVRYIKEYMSLTFLYTCTIPVNISGVKKRLLRTGNTPTPFTLPLSEQWENKGTEQPIPLLSKSVIPVGQLCNFAELEHVLEWLQF